MKYLFIKNTNKQKKIRDHISVEMQVACTLYYLADEGRLRKAANAFGISKSSASNQQKNFMKLMGSHQCLGGIDGTHIRIEKQIPNPTDYINRKSTNS